MNMISIPPLKQGDLLLVELTGSRTQKGVKPGTGWLLVTEVSTDDRIITANFCPKGQEGGVLGHGYGQVIWPEYKVKAFLRGTHGECSPFAAIIAMFNKPAAISLT